MSTLTLVPRTALANDANPTAGDLHRLVMGMFPAGLAGRDSHNILWRAEGQNILVRSDIEPTNLPAGARTIIEPALPYLAGDTVRFTVAVNPVTRRNQDEGGRVRRVESLTDPVDLVTEKLALALRVDDVHSEVTWRTQRKGTPLAVSTVTGIATVTDTNELARILREGIGRAKAFGCGLLTILPA